MDGDKVGQHRDGGAESSAGVLPFLFELLEILSWRFVWVVLLTLCIGLISAVSLILLMPMLQVVGLEVAGGAGERLADLVFSVLRAVGLEATLPTVLVINALAVIATALLARYQSVFAVQVNQAVVNKLRQEMYEAICNAEWSFIVGQRATRFNHVLLAELERVGAAASALVALLVGGGRAAAYVVVALVLSPAMTAVTVVSGLGLSLLLLRKTQLGRIAGMAVSTAYRDLYAATGEHFSGLRFTKSHGLENRQVEAYRGATSNVARTHVAVTRNQADVAFWLQLGTVIALSVVIYFAFAVFSLPLATVLLLIYLFSRLLPMLSSVQKSYQSLLNYLPSYSVFMEALQKCMDSREASISVPASDDAPPLGLSEGIDLRDVSFGFDGTDRPALVGLDLYIEAGKTTALVGLSGAGKSTIADMLVGLISPQTGQVLIDGVQLKEELRRSWRRQVGYVSQDVFLFHDTIRANLLVSRPTATETELWEALESASAGFVADLPRGLETVVGDRGTSLSGGERQRLALARALLRQPSLLVMDEATSSLDATNEERVRESVAKLSGKMTILLIAHRLASVRSADVIHYVESGRIVESGTWESLLARKSGRFRTLAEGQVIQRASDTGLPLALQ